MPRPRTSLLFGLQCHVSRLPVPVEELRFAPPRRWRFDYAWPDRKLALEVQGGLFVNGRHSRGAALVKEHEKLNMAAMLGWRVLYVTPQQVQNGQALSIVESALRPALTVTEVE
jgi:hypothetical protein